MHVNAGSSIIYEVPESITSFKIFAFARKSGCGMTLLASDSLNSFTELTTRLESFPPYKNVYGFLIPFTITCEEFPANTKYVKLLFNEESQLGKIEIEYSSK